MEPCPRAHVVGARGSASPVPPDKRRRALNWDQIEGKWKEMTGKVQQQWGKLTDDDLAQVKGNRRELAGKIQSAYGVTKEEADKQIDDWMSHRQ